MELTTKQINRDIILQLLAELAPCIERHWGEKVKGSHGAVSQVDYDDQWKMSPIRTAELPKYLLSEEQKVDFKISEWDYWIYDQYETEYIRVCHESDLHFTTNSMEFINEIKLVLKQHSIGFYIKE